MKLIQDEGAYRQLIQKFLESDGAPVGGNSVVDADAHTHLAITPGFYGAGTGSAKNSFATRSRRWSGLDRLPLPQGPMAATGTSLVLSKTIERPAQLMHIAWRLCASAYRPGRQARRTLGSWM